MHKPRIKSPSVTLDLGEALLQFVLKLENIRPLNAWVAQPIYILYRVALVREKHLPVVELQADILQNLIKLLSLNIVNFGTRPPLSVLADQIEVLLRVLGLVERVQTLNKDFCRDIGLLQKITYFLPDLHFP